MVKADVQAFDFGNQIGNCDNYWARECKKKLFVEGDSEFIWDMLNLRCLCVRMCIGPIAYTGLKHMREFEYKLCSIAMGCEVKERAGISCTEVKFSLGILFISEKFRVFIYNIYWATLYVKK